MRTPPRSISNRPYRGLKGGGGPTAAPPHTRPRPHSPGPIAPRPTAPPPALRSPRCPYFNFQRVWAIFNSWTPSSKAESAPSPPHPPPFFPSPHFSPFSLYFLNASDPFSSPWSTLGFFSPLYYPNKRGPPQLKTLSAFPFQIRVCPRVCVRGGGFPNEEN